MGERQFRQEYLCDFSGSEDSLFNEDLIRSLIKDDIRPLVEEPGFRKRDWGMYERILTRGSGRRIRFGMWSGSM
jgi:hypothetical protein